MMALIDALIEKWRNLVLKPPDRSSIFPSYPPSSTLPCISSTTTISTTTTSVAIATRPCL